MKLVIVFILSVCAVIVQAQQVQIPFTITNTVNGQPTSVGFTVAAHPKGTSELDSALGEREIPSLPPPAGVFIVYSIPPSAEYMWLSPLDVRKLEVGKQHLVEYTIGMTWNAGKLNVSWGPIPALIDSAYIVDVVSDFPNNFIKVKLEPGKSYETINTAITKLKVLVWYNATSLGVLDDAASLRIYPNPCSDELFLQGAAIGAHFDVIDVAGSVISTGIVREDRQSVSTTLLPAGMYVLRIIEADGTVHMRKINRR